MAPYNVTDLYTFDSSFVKEENGPVIGTDEVGRGPLAGPVVAAAVQLDLTDPIDGIKDSKKLSADARERLYTIITSQAVAWSIGQATVEEIDDINILQASLLAMKRAIDTLDPAHATVLIDGNKTIRDLPDTRQVAVVAGDSKSASIAAASIVAKVTRDKLMMDYHKKYPIYGFNTNKGYPTKPHRSSIIKHGITPVHRNSFCEKLLVQTELNFLDI